MSLGKIDCVVATSSLDLGIDWGDVDLVIQDWITKRDFKIFTTHRKK